LSTNKKVFFPLEDRIVLDAAALAVATDNLNDDNHSVNDYSNSDTNDNDTNQNPLDSIVEGVAPLANNRVVIVDERSDPDNEIRNYLEQNNVTVHTIKADQDGVKEISSILGKYQTVETLDIISHGDEGEMHLGNAILDNSTIDQYYQELQNWSKSFTDTADIMIYACDVASGVDGVHFVERISQITGTDIASSDDVTGKSGDWTLEYFIGNVDSGLIIDSNADIDVDLKSKSKDGGSKNKAPEVEDIKVKTAADTNISIALEGSDDKAESQLTFSFIELPNSGQGKFVLNGSTIQLGDEISYDDRDDIIFDPAANFDGKAKAKYVATDDDGAKSKYGKIYVEVAEGKGGNNSDPIAKNDSINVDEDSSKTIDVLANDSDPDGDNIIIESVTYGQKGSTQIVNGKIVYTPNANFNGTDTFKYTVSDGKGGKDTATVTVCVDPVNDAPDAKDDIATTNKNTAKTIDVLSNDTDIDGDTLTIESATQGSNGNVQIVNGKIVYTPNNDFSGTDTFHYTVNDGNGGTDTAKVTVTVTHVNENPDAQNDNVDAYEDVPVTINVLANDTDGDGDTLTIESVTNGNNGTTEILNGLVLYTPNQGFSGTDTFTYTVNDGKGGTDTATVTVDVCPNPDIHFSDAFTVGLGDDYIFADEDPLFATEDFKSDENYLIRVDMQTLGSPHTVSIDQDLIDNGSVVIHTGANGTNSLWFKGKGDDIVAALQTLKFTSSANDSTNETIVACVFREIPGEGFKHVDINYIDAIIDSSVAANDDTLKAFEDTPLTINPDDLLANDEGNASIVSFTQPEHGTIVEDGNGNLVYTPDSDFNGTDTFTYTISTGQGNYSNNLIVNGSFEADNVSDHNGAWEVYPNSITGWQTDIGPGIEIQTGNTGGIGATDGNQKVELDSHFATDTNSNMYQDVDVSNANDTLLLQFDYSARNHGDTAASSVIEVYWDGELVDTITAAASGWKTYSYNVSSVGKDTARVEFRASGTDDTYGGLIDNVKLLDSNPSTSTATVTIEVCPVNDAPVAGDDSITTAEDTPVLIDVLNNDDDIDGDTLTIVSVTDGSGGTVVIENGHVKYTPDADFVGTDTFTYTVEDGNGGTDTATVTVEVTPVNDAPVANTDNVDTNEDTPVVIDVLANDDDVDGDTLTIDSVTDGSHGTVVIENGQVKYTPDADFNGNDSFTYTITDGNGETSTGTVNVTVNPVNDAPLAEDDTVTTDEDTPITIDVLSNDDDVDGDALTITSVSNPASGTAQIVNGQIKYTPNNNFNGTDTFTYTVSDGNGGTDTATVTVNVDSLNDAPVALDDVVATYEDTVVAINVLINDTDADSDVLTITDVTDGANGTVVIENDQVKYTPNADFNGVDTFTYTISDGNGGTATATVTVHVCPVADNLQAHDDSYTANDGDNLTSELITQENTPLDIQVSDLLENDEGVNLLPASAKVIIESTPANGTLYLVDGQNMTQLNNGDTVETNATIRFVPNQGVDGIDNFQYSIHVPYEGFDSLADYQTPTLGSPNGNGMDAVVVTDPGEHEVSVSFVSKSAGFNNTLGYYIYDCHGNITETDVIWSKISGSQPDSVIGNLAEGQFLGFFLAADGGDAGLNDSSEIRFVDANGQPANYNLAVAGQSQFNLQYKDGNDNWVDFNAGANKGVFHSNAAELNPNGLEHVVTGKVDVNGQSQLKVTFEDLYVNSDWDANDLTFLVNVADQTSNVANVTINVENTNDAPIANEDNVTTLEDVAILIDVLDNDTDADGDTLTIDSVTNGLNGTVVIENGQVKYTPDADFFGQDSFTYTIKDDSGETSTATVKVNVLPINDAPIANPDSATTDEDTPVEIDVLANDTDIEDNTLTLQSVSHGANGTVTIVNGKAVYTPDEDFVGTDTFTYAVSDGNSGLATGTVTVTVNPVNDAPVAFDDVATTDEDTPVVIDVLANDDDVDGDTLTIVSVTEGQNGTVVIENGQVKYTPDAEFNGVDTFTYTISDGTETHTGTVTVTVNPVNDAPVAGNYEVSTQEDTSINVDVLSNTSDPDGDTVTLLSVNNPSHGTVQIVNGQVLYTPDLDYNGNDEFTYVVSDGNGGTDTGTVYVIVTPVNDAPVANDDFAITDEDVPVTIDVLDNDFDVDGDTIQIDFVTNGNHGTTQVVNGEVVYTPNPNFFGTDTFTTYVITDGQGGSAQAMVEVTVNPVNDDPVAVDDSAFTSEDTAVSVDVVGNDTDIEGDTLSLESVTDGANGTVTIVNGEAVYTPNQGFSGTDTFTYVVSDGNGGTDTGTVTVEVVSSNEAPIARPDSAITLQGKPITINVLANDNDVDGTIVDVVPVNQPSYGTITVNPNGSIVYNPNGGFTGTDTFTYRVIDNDNNTSLPAVVTVTVKPLTLPDFGPGANDEDDSDGTPEPLNNSSNPGKLGDIGNYDPYGKISNFDYSDYALRLVFELPDVVKKSEGSQTFGIPRTSFEHRDDKEIQFEALMADGSDLPAWMEFDAEKGEFRISPPDLPNENFEILVTAKDDDGNEAESTFTLILLDESSVAFFEEESGENEEDEDISENSAPVDAAFEALLKEFNEFTKRDFNDGFVPFSKQLNNNLKTELDSRALELIKNMYAA